MGSLDAGLVWQWDWRNLLYKVSKDMYSVSTRICIQYLPGCVCLCLNVFTKIEVASRWSSVAMKYELLCTLSLVLLDLGRWYLHILLHSLIWIVFVSSLLCYVVPSCFFTLFNMTCFCYLVPCYVYSIFRVILIQGHCIALESDFFLLKIQTRNVLQ